jgi:hypothetical protein
MADRKNYWHNEGQAARGEGRPYKAPHGIVEDLTTWTESGMRRNAEENAQYRQGWKHTDGQKKR